MKLPPYAELLKLTVESHEDGAAPILAMPFESDVLGRPGFLHGGAIGGLLEMAAIVALHDALGNDDARVKPVNVTIDFMRGGREKTTRAQGIVTRLGTRVANVEAVAWQDDRDRPIAGARMNYLIARS
ncbi:PaaI family thioesterase [Stakelama marina]|uniref:PaaI family thioesterase n=1 Tax=Stakelama marina TaxID=2826939 RepID=A0A8T4IIB6_9SPHN|nr:PaaI family thioesterase [Stakelama marina]MBR0552835.1 PaaI family thioesterase [Stakelama marina]